MSGKVVRLYPQRVDWTRRVLLNADAKGTALLVLLVLAEHADNSGHACPSVPRMALLAHCSERQVKRDLKDLIEAKQIRLVREGGGRKRAAHYKITVSDEVKWSQKTVTSATDSKSGKGDIHETPFPTVKGDICDQNAKPVLSVKLSQMSPKVEEYNETSPFLGDGTSNEAADNTTATEEPKKTGTGSGA